MATNTARRRSVKLGQLIDELHAAREDRLSQQRYLDALKEKEGAAEALVLAALQKQNLQKAAGAFASVSITVKTVGQVEPERWADVYAFIKKHGAFELLQRRLNNAAVRERVEGGQDVPGVKIVQILDLSVRGL